MNCPVLKNLRFRDFLARTCSPAKRSAIVLAIALLSSPVIAAPLVKDGDVVGIIGDSITEQREYSVVIEDYLRVCAPVAKVGAIQFGWSGEAAPRLAGRIGNDIIPFKLTVATTCYGMNDGGYGPIDDTKIRNYRESMTKVVAKLKEAGVRQIVVGSPGCVDSSQFKKTDAAMYNHTLAVLGGVAKEVATEQGVAFADVYSVMLETMKKTDAKWGDAYQFTGVDGIHPDPNGHLAMGYAFLKAMGFDGNIGSITIDLSNGMTTASEGHKIISADAGSIEIESHRWPYCFVAPKDKSGDPKSAKAITEVLPFQDELNRFMLVVKGVAPDVSVVVTWGSQGRKFTGAQLAKGINLAAEFVDDNPFSEAFKKLDSAVRAKQTMEVPLVKKLINAIPSFASILPDEQDALAHLREAALKQDSKLMEDTATLVVPVKHTLKITVDK